MLNYEFLSSFPLLTGILLSLWPTKIHGSIYDALVCVIYHSGDWTITSELTHTASFTELNDMYCIDE